MATSQTLKHKSEILSSRSHALQASTLNPNLLPEDATLYESTDPSNSQFSNALSAALRQCHDSRSEAQGSGGLTKYDTGRSPPWLIKRASARLSMPALGDRPGFVSTHPLVKCKRLRLSLVQLRCVYSGTWYMPLHDRMPL